MCKPQIFRQHMRGFSLLEMIAALTILSIGSVVLFSWLGQTMSQLNRFESQERESMAKLQAIEYLTMLNPAKTPEGKQAFERFRMEWKGAPARESRDTVSPSGGLGLYEVQLYDVQVATFDRWGRDWFHFSVKLVGHRQVRQPVSGTPF